MEQQALQSSAAEAVTEAATRWKAQGAPRLVRAVENAVYEIRVGDERRILRLTPDSRRTAKQVEAELLWIERLAVAGVDVASPLRSARGALIEQVHSGAGCFIAACFSWAPGEPLRPGSPRWNRDTFTAWGRTFARMHELAPTDDIALARPHWEQEDVVARYPKHLQGDERRALDEQVVWMRSLPADSSRFGLIHGDLSHGNLFAHERGVTAFDFDDSCRHWHLYDLAIALHLALLAHRDRDACAAAAPGFLVPLIAGYRELRPIGREDLALLPRFLRLRDLLLLAWCRMKWPEDQTRPFALTVAANVADDARYLALDRSQ